MAESEEKVGDVKDVTCCLCLEQYQDPRVLACLHTYCRHCLESLAEHSQGDSISCPQCREKIQISVDKVQNLKEDFLLSNLIKRISLSQGKKDEESVDCETCQSDVATGRCTDCSEFMCEFCINSHRRLLRTKQHKIIGIKEATDKGTSNCKSHYCPHHIGERLALFCSICDELICRECAINTHQDHKYYFPNAIIDHEKEIVKTKMEVVKAKVSDLSHAHANVFSLFSRLGAENKALTSEIDEFIDAQVSTLEEIRMNLKDEVISDNGKIKKQLASQEDYLCISIANCNSCVKFAERFCQAGSGDEIEVLSLKKELVSRLSSLADIPIQDVELANSNRLSVDNKFWASMTEKALLEKRLQTLDHQQCVVTMGAGAEPGVIYSTFVCQEIIFSLTVKDCKGEQFEAPVRVKATIRKTTPEQNEENSIFVSSDGKGIYSFMYTPLFDGDYELSVKLNGKEVRGSPFKWTVKPGKDFPDFKNSRDLLKDREEHIILKLRLIQLEWGDASIGVAHCRNMRQVWGCSPGRKYTKSTESSRSVSFWKVSQVYTIYLSRDERGGRMIIANNGTREREVFDGIICPVRLYTYGRWEIVEDIT
ncbi:tripartite motif-containing protein 45 isoform X2 [Nematostella vectensis]|uniref:tripartite motif-containing protein 45 isoform X2 n=1 Tax=Nematostella vectensis TaxID=45351 RepID=UPI00138FDE3D|nr:tripartite motif-containing protein 45 isoform X2 [Nematostella vectensis]